MFLATWNCFYVPFNVAFEADIFGKKPSAVMNWLIDILFMIDVVVNFRTAILDEKTGKEIYNGKVIALNYLRGKFWIDMLASLPFDFITLFFRNADGNSLTFQLFGLLKLVRILRLSRLITYMNLKNDVKMSLKLGKLIFFLVMYIHCVGCAWFFIAKQNENWIPPLDYVYIETDIYEEDALQQY
jgi:hypothetical protein